MSEAQKQLNPTGHTEQELKVLAFTIAGLLNKNVVVDKPMRAEEAAEFLNISKTHLYRLINSGAVVPRKFLNDSTPYFFPSEIVAVLKKKV